MEIYVCDFSIAMILFGFIILLIPDIWYKKIWTFMTYKVLKHQKYKVLASVHSWDPSTTTQVVVNIRIVVVISL
jgi:hypothetical protein